MLHFIAALFLSIGSLFHGHATDYTRMVDRVQSSIVRIEIHSSEGSGRCSGFVVQSHIVLTANHCTDGDLVVDGVPASLIKRDGENDLAILYVSTGKPSLSFRLTPVVRFEILTSIGYGYGLHTLTPLQNRVIMVNGDLESDGIPKGIIVAPGYIGGMSGGPVVDASGLVVGIIQRGSAQIGYGVPVSVILSFLGA